MKTSISLLITVLFSLNLLQAQYVSKVWKGDLGDGRYKNPIINADYSDPDVCLGADGYYMVASSFNCVPGLPVLFSKDLVNWSLVGHALSKQIPEDFYNKVQHGSGVWAPSIRYHNKEYYVYWGNPDFGIFMVKASNPRGPWTEPHLVKAGKGLIDVCPLWDEDGKAYMSFALAGSRAGLKSVLLVAPMSPMVKV
jgi:beta-xylosidase